MLTCRPPEGCAKQPVTLATKEYETTAGLVAAQRNGRGTCCANYASPAGCRAGVACDNLHPGSQHISRLKWNEKSTASAAATSKASEKQPSTVAVLVRRTNTTYNIAADALMPTEHLAVAVRMGSGTACSHHLRETCNNGATCRFLHPHESALLTTLRSELSNGHALLEKQRAKMATGAKPQAASGPLPTASGTASTMPAAPSPAKQAGSWGSPTSAAAAAAVSPPPASAPKPYRSDGDISLQLSRDVVLHGFKGPDFESTTDAATIARTGTATACREHLQGSCAFGTLCPHAHPTTRVMRERLLDHVGPVRRANLVATGSSSTTPGESTEHSVGTSQPKTASATTVTGDPESIGRPTPERRNDVAAVAPQRPATDAPPSVFGGSTWGGLSETSYSHNASPQSVVGPGSVGIAPSSVPMAAAPPPGGALGGALGGGGVLGPSMLYGGIGGALAGSDATVSMGARKNTEEDEADALLELVYSRDATAANDVAASSVPVTPAQPAGQAKPAAAEDTAGTFNVSAGSVEGSVPRTGGFFGSITEAEHRTPSAGVSPAMRGSAAPLSNGLFSSSLTRATPPNGAKLPSPMLQPTAFQPEQHPMPPLDTQPPAVRSPGLAAASPNVAPGSVGGTSSAAKTSDPWAPRVSAEPYRGTSPGLSQPSGSPAPAETSPYGPTAASFAGQDGIVWTAGAHPGSGGPAPPPYPDYMGTGSTPNGSVKPQTPPPGGPIAVTAESKEVYYIDRSEFEITRNLAATVRIGSGIACSHHLRDRCNNGASCRFLHPVEPTLATTLRSEVGRNHPVLRTAPPAPLRQSPGGSLPRQRFSGGVSPPVEAGELPVPKSRLHQEAVAEATRTLQTADAPALTDAASTQPTGPAGAWASRPRAAEHAMPHTSSAQAAAQAAVRKSPEHMSWASTTPMGPACPSTPVLGGGTPKGPVSAVPAPKSQLRGSATNSPAMGSAKAPHGAANQFSTPKQGAAGVVATSQPPPMPMTSATAHEDPAVVVPVPRPQVKGRTLLEHITNAAAAPVPGREPCLGLRCHACPEPANTAVARHRVVLGCAHILCGDCLTKVARANAKKRVPCPCCGKFIAETDFNPKTRPPPPAENQQMHGAKAVAAASAVPAKPAAQPAVPTVTAPIRSSAAAAAPKEQAAKAATTGLSADPPAAAAAAAAAAIPPAAAAAAAKPARRKPTDAERLAAAGAAAEAIGAWGEVIDGHTRRPGTDKVLAGYHVKRGQLHFDQGDADAARGDADRGLKADPSSVHCLLLRGKALHAQAKHGQAVSSLQRVLTAEPKHQEAAALLAQVKKDKAEAAAAAAAAQSAEEESQRAASATPPLSVDNDGASSSGTAAAKGPSAGGKGGKKPSERIATFISSSVEAARRKEYGLVVECLSNVFDLFPCLTREGRCNVLVRRAIAYYRLKKPAKAKQDARRAHDLNSVAATPWPLVRQLLVLLKDEPQRNSSPPPVSSESPPPPGAAEGAAAADEQDGAATDPKQLDAIIEDQLTTPIPQLLRWMRSTPATAMVDVVWSEGEDEEVVFDFSPVEPKGCTSSPGLLDTACLCPNCRLKRTVGPPAPTSEALSIEGQIFAPLEHYAPMSPGLYHERELMEAKAPPAAPETLRHLYHLVSMACIMTGAIVDNPPPRRMISVIPKESVATAIARYRAFFKAGIKIGAIPKWLDENAGIAVHERVVPRVHMHCANQTTGLMGLQLFAPCYLYFALSVLGDATIAASSLCILEGHSPLWTAGR